MDSSKMSKSTRQRGAAAANRVCAGDGRAALFPAARNRFRTGRKFQLRRAGDAIQRRSRERPGQFGQPHADDDREILRLADSKARARVRWRRAERGSRRGASIAEAQCRATMQYQFSLTLEAIWGLISEVDQIITTEKPWTLAGEPAQRRLEAVLYAAAEALRIVTVLAHPVIPAATEAIWKLLGQAVPLRQEKIDELQWGQLKPGMRIAKPGGVFPRIEKTEAIERMEKMEQRIQQARRCHLHRRPAQHSAVRPPQPLPEPLWRLHRQASKNCDRRFHKGRDARWAGARLLNACLAPTNF